jgi:uncharacterized protein with HEPN domain
VTSSKPTTRYQDIRRNIAKIREYLAHGGGLGQVLTEQSMAYDAIRMCFLEISEAAIKLGALAELHEPEIPWSAIRGFGNHLRHTYDEMDLNAIEHAVAVNQERRTIRGSWIPNLPTKVVKRWSRQQSV